MHRFRAVAARRPGIDVCVVHHPPVRGPDDSRFQAGYQPTLSVFEVGPVGEICGHRTLLIARSLAVAPSDLAGQPVTIHIG
jgi:hypothetical protein